MPQENTVFTRPLRLGLLIDAENFSGAHAPRMLTRVKQLGRPIVRRAYGDWTTSQLALWKGVLHTLAIRPCQQFHYRHGRNASDAAPFKAACDAFFCLDTPEERVESAQ